MVTIKIEKEFMNWIIDLINIIMKELRTAGIISKDTKYLKQRFKNRKRKSHTIKLIRDLETNYIIFQFDVKMLKDSLLLLKKGIIHLIPTMVGIKTFLNLCNNTNNDISEDYQMFKDIWKDRYIYCIFTIPEDKDEFFNGTKIIAKTIDRDEWEVVFIKYGEPKNGKKYSKIDKDLKRTVATNVQNWVSDNCLPSGESFESLEQAKYRLMNGDDDSEITIPQNEFKEEKHGNIEK